MPQNDGARRPALDPRRAALPGPEGGRVTLGGERKD